MLYDKKQRQTRKPAMFYDSHDMVFHPIEYKRRLTPSLHDKTINHTTLVSRVRPSHNTLEQAQRRPQTAATSPKDKPPSTFPKPLPPPREVYSMAPR
jgi:hypothetical protein